MKVLSGGHNYEVKFLHNNRAVSTKTNGQTFCDIYLLEHRVATGTAVCGKDDNFNKAMGRKVALKRALEALSNTLVLSKENRKEFWKAYRNR